MHGKSSTKLNYGPRIFGALLSSLVIEARILSNNNDCGVPIQYLAKIKTAILSTVKRSSGLNDACRRTVQLPLLTR